MINRLIIWLYDHRGRLFLLICSPLLLYAFFYAFFWLSDKYDELLEVSPEYPAYKIPPKYLDDTLRVAVIGDSWAEIHASLECDTIFCRVANSLTTSPVKCFSRGHSGKMTKEIYNDMFADRTVEHAWEKDFCTQPLLEQHPDYCVIMAGINDLRLFRSTDYYTGNYRLIIRLLLRNGIRPVVMEMPDVDFLGSFERRVYYERWMFHLLSVWTGVDCGSAQKYRDAMHDMLNDTNLKDSVLFIPVDHWSVKGLESNLSIYVDDKFHLNFHGYQVLDSCMATDIIDDYKKNN